MRLLKKCDANDRPPASRNKFRPSFRPVGQAHRANPSEMKPHGPLAGRLTFGEDFTREHSLPGLQITSIEFSGSF